MPKTLMLLLALLVSTAWLTAQQYPQTGSHSSGSSEAGQTTVQGCLHGSGGSYTLASDSGTNYQLEGDTATLSKHVGHEVRITGTPSKEGSSTGSMSQNSTKSNSASEETLMVHSVKHMSKTCSSASK